MFTSMAQRMAATKQKTPLNAIKMRRVTAKQPLGVHSKRANKLNVKDKPLNTWSNLYVCRKYYASQSIWRNSSD